MARSLKVTLVVMLLVASSHSTAWFPSPVSAREASGRGDPRPDSEPGELVVVVRDVTAEVDCRREIQDNDGPRRAEQCGPGTVIAAERTTLTLASRKQGDRLVELTGNRTTDAALIDEAVAALHDEVTPTPITAAACRETVRTIYTSYRISNSSNYRVLYALNYEVTSGCTVRAIRDKSRANNPAIDRAKWVESCSRNFDQCRGRNIVLTAAYTPYLCCLDNAAIGWRYRNESVNLDECDFVCVNWYGYYDFDDR